MSDVLSSNRAECTKKERLCENAHAHIEGPNCRVSSDAGPRSTKRMASARGRSDRVASLVLCFEQDLSCVSAEQIESRVL